MRAGLATLALAVSLVAGCAPASVTALREEPPAVPQRTHLEQVPFVPQTAYHCGPASLAMLLAWSGEASPYERVVEQVYTPDRQGSLQSDVLAAARRNGRLATPVASLRALLREVAAGHPVLVLQNRGLNWAPAWHYAVVTGYDLEAGELILHSGTEENLHIALATFERTWARGGHWALTVLPPGQLPAAADALSVLEAAAALERNGHAAAAATAYSAALQRWPRHMGALVGLANARHAQGDLPGAAEALQRAVAAHPDAAPAWHNLALVLADLERPEQAARAARQALDAAPEGQRARYRRSLTEVLEAPSPRSAQAL